MRSSKIEIRQWALLGRVVLYISDTDTIVDQNCMCVILYKCYEFTNDFNRILK